MRKRASKTSLFLMERLLVILFFSVAAAICLRVFAGAKQRSQDSVDLNAAVLAAQSAGECWKAAGGNPEKAAALLEGTVDGDAVVQYFDASWSLCGRESACAQLTLQWQGTAARIQIAKMDGTEIYALSVRSLGGAGA